MKKWINIIAAWVIGSICFAVLKIFMDIFTDPITGLLITTGMPDEVVAFFTFIPWLAWIVLFIWTIWYIGKSDKPKYPMSEI